MLAAGAGETGLASGPIGRTWWSRLIVRGRRPAEGASGEEEARGQSASFLDDLSASETSPEFLEINEQGDGVTVSSSWF